MFFYAGNLGGILIKVLGKINSFLRLKTKPLREGEEGTTALEFSLMAWPFFLMTFGIFELSMMFAAGSLLDGSLNDAARLIKTGQLQQGDPDGAEELFQQALCAKAPVLIDCTEIRYEVISMGDGDFFDAANTEAQYDANGAFIPGGFTPGGVSDVVLVRAIYDYQLFTPLVAQFMTGLTGHYRMVSTIVFQTEPYEFETE